MHVIRLNIAQYHVFPALFMAMRQLYFYGLHLACTAFRSATTDVRCKGEHAFLIHTNFLAYILSLVQAIPLERWGVGMGVYMYDYVSVHRNEEVRVTYLLPLTINCMR